MGLRAFVARSGWNKTPISDEEWREAASTLPELSVHRGPEGGPVYALLRGSQRRRITLHHGFLCGEHVDRRLVAVLFVLADRLGAQVFSEHRRVYRDQADWEQRVRRRSGRHRHAHGTGAPSGVALASGSARSRMTGLEPALAGLMLLIMLVMFALQ